MNLTGKISIIVLFTFALIGCASKKTAKTPKKNTFTWYAMNRNVCAQMKGKVLVYAFFANTKKTLRWSEEDI